MGMFSEGNGGGGIWALAASQTTGAATQTVSVTGLAGIRFRVEIMTPESGIGFAEYFYLTLNNIGLAAAYPRAHGFLAITTATVTGSPISTPYISLTGTAISGPAGILRITSDIMCDPATAVGFATSLYVDAKNATERTYKYTTRLHTASIGAVTSIQFIASVANGIPAGTRIDVYQSAV